MRLTTFLPLMLLAGTAVAVPTTAQYETAFPPPPQSLAPADYCQASDKEVHMHCMELMVRVQKARGASAVQDALEFAAKINMESAKTTATLRSRHLRSPRPLQSQVALQIKGALSVSRDTIKSWFFSSEFTGFTGTLKANLSGAVFSEIIKTIQKDAPGESMAQVRITLDEANRISILSAGSVADYAVSIMKTLRTEAFALLVDDITTLFKLLVSDTRKHVSLKAMLENLGSRAATLLRRSAGTMISTLHTLLLAALPITLSALISAGLGAINPTLATLYAKAQPVALPVLATLVDAAISGPLRTLRSRLDATWKSEEIEALMKATTNVPSSLLQPSAEQMAAAKDTSNAAQVLNDLVAIN
ncbi:hypothetical protein THASP1DRAFT_24163 [Thamnocephalis sphaerospora]|uniref:Uncharacterized protein n=1 Tax=Thamnocephalis sphaerospora TaxID=78915 RepID=A0A4P9XQZ3_9FUNG|nr:hypothetical protein THASP1DRAFT_24163 [Thamnocephalis sphaerospora]|eukprot:RKP07730.1 hypothetical protein THASP1DRAFT_24163 [Thamnocephalis sphaerospora]